MNNKDKDAKERMIRTAIDLLNEVSDIEKITVRQITERAKVGVGLINYHFGSKDNLLSIAVGSVLSEMASKFLNQANYLNLKPVNQLKNMLKELCSAAVVNKKLIQFMLTQGITTGDMHALLYLIPVLKDIFGSQRDEIELRVIALQILQPLQVAGIAPAEFQMYSGFDLYDTEARNKFIDMLIDNLIAIRKESETK